MESKYFRGNRRSELQEMREELQKSCKDRKKEAIKKIIGAMALGKDVSSLFPEVVNCIQTNNLELKKLVYLYVINYAKVQPELAILAVNTLCKDTKDRNPLIRALAIRTMGYIRLPAITEHLVEPLKRCSTDSDPYVRKTVAICIAKLYGISPQLVIDEGFIDVLEKMLSDTNPVVVANTVATFVEISECSEEDLLARFLNKNPAKFEAILAALNGSMEWGQVYILDALALYQPPSQTEAKAIIDTVIPRFSHINPAVVLSAIKVVIKMMSKISDKEHVNALQGKLAAPLVTLASLEPEIQYVALRSILIIIEKWPRLLEGHVRAFYCKNKDPLYVRVEKLDIIVRLATTSNFQKILVELREYATDIDLDFVRKAIRAIGTLAIRLEAALSSCTAALMDLLRMKVPHLTEECTIVYRDILRAYPDNFSNDIFSLCADGEYLHGIESKSALIWIVGQHASKIPDAEEYISNLSETLHDEHDTVQLSLLTAAVKVTLTCGRSCGLIDRVLRRCLHESQSPDVRSRAQMYLKLLEQGDDIASRVVMTPLPPTGEETIEINVLESLLGSLGHVSSVYHLPAWAVSFKGTLPVEDMKEKDAGDDSSSAGDLLDIHDSYESNGRSPSLEAYDDGDSARKAIGNDDYFFSSYGKVHRYTCKDEVVLTPYQQGSNGQMGLQIVASLYREEEKMTIKLHLTNKTAETIILQAVQCNKNSFGLGIASQIETPVIVAPEKSNEIHIPLAANVALSNTPPDNPITLQVAIKTNVDVFYFRVFYELPIVLLHDATLSKQEFEAAWLSLPMGETVDMDGVSRSEYSNRLPKVCLMFVGSGMKGDLHIGEVNECYYGMTTNNLRLLAVACENKMHFKADAAALIPLFIHTVKKALRQ